MYLAVPMLSQTISELPKASLSKRGLVHNHSYENDFNFHVNEISFSYERMSTKTSFEKEAKGNSEMAYRRLQLPVYTRDKDMFCWPIKIQSFDNQTSKFTRPLGNVLAKLTQMIVADLSTVWQLKTWRLQ